MPRRHVAAKTTGETAKKAKYAEALAEADKFLQASPSSVDARYVVVFTESGSTARLVSYARPVSRVLAFTPYDRIYRQLALTWGVTPFIAPHYDTTDEMLESGMKVLAEQGLVDPGDIAVVVCGTTTLKGATNMIKVTRFE